MDSESRCLIRWEKGSPRNPSLTIPVFMSKKQQRKKEQTDLEKDKAPTAQEGQPRGGDPRWSSSLVQLTLILGLSGLSVGLMLLFANYILPALNVKLAVETPGNVEAVSRYMEDDDEEVKVQYLKAVLKDDQEKDLEKIFAANQIYRAGGTEEVAKVMEELEVEAFYKYMRPPYIYSDYYRQSLSELTYHLGEQSMQKGDFQKALSSFQISTSLSPGTRERAEAEALSALEGEELSAIDLVLLGYFFLDIGSIEGLEKVNQVLASDQEFTRNEGVLKAYEQLLNKDKNASLSLRSELKNFPKNLRVYMLTMKKTRDLKEILDELEERGVVRVTPSAEVARGDDMAKSDTYPLTIRNRNTTVEIPFSEEYRNDRVSFLAMGDQASEFPPVLEITINNEKKVNMLIGSTNWEIYEVYHEAPIESLAFQLMNDAFDRDYLTEQEKGQPSWLTNRNVYLGGFWFD